MGTSKVDDEVTEILTNLYTMQEDVGAKPKTSEEEKKSKAENVATMGTGRKAQTKGSRFLKLRSSIIQRVKNIHSKLSEVKEIESAGYRGDNRTQLIKLRAETREEIRQATDEWKEIDAFYKKEARKKRSKFTAEELETQEQLVQQLHQQIEKIREAQLDGFADGGIKQYVLGWGASSSWNGRGGGASLTKGQRIQIQELEQRDTDFDRQLDEIGEGIKDLAEIAALQYEEVKHQNVMLDHLDAKIDHKNERVVNVNSRIKKLLYQVGYKGVAKK